MMKSPLLAVVAALYPCACLAEGVFLSLGGGIGDVNVKESLRSQGADDDDRNWVNEGSLGYRFRSNAVVEASIARGVSDVWFFDFVRYEYRDERVMAGYSFDVGRRFAVTPQIGISSWDVRLTDVFLLSDPDGVRDLSGEDWVWRLRGEIEFSEAWRLYLSYTQARHAFGEISLPSVGFKVQF
jgi:hypothetical protein